ncbi:protein XRI1-like [Magnolia sinica]|uniref:protein XRI1-like n=1 Tax=Magnolia sinica TaxID=86752 RepID=UPI0026599937|nr:protein XRI1-like [Magnolia sinica]
MNPSVMQATPFSMAHSSTGYLQDAIIEWTDRCKRRRVMLFDHDQVGHRSDGLLHDYWNADFNEDPFENFNTLSQESDINVISDDLLNSSISSISNGTIPSSTEMKTHEDSASEHEHFSPRSSYKDSTPKIPDEKDTLISKNPISSVGHRRRIKKNVGMRVAYPFAVVKPGGIDGGVTLDDINERILMRPTRPVRHPVGEFACFPCVSMDGHGPSGKAVAALTRIHTQGRGTITIIRTKG